jgi:prevent-host-death family protein
MRSVQSTSLRKTLFKELREVSSGREPLQILRHGKPIAVLVPAAGEKSSKKKPLIDLDAISSFCKGHRLKSLCLFGSVLRDDFDEESDVDVMVDSGERDVSLRELCDMMDELEAMFGRKVDLVFKKNVLALDKKYKTREEILMTASEVYHEAA